MIHLDRITKQYHGFNHTGHNAAVKSPTLKMIVRLISSITGTVYINGRDIQKRSIALKRQSTMLEKISARNLTLMDLSVQESAPEEIYVKLMTDSTE